jgi:beta-lactamase superfamily II metal-dependent hydrolase
MRAAAGLLALLLAGCLGPDFVVRVEAEPPSPAPAPSPGPATPAPSLGPAAPSPSAPALAPPSGNVTVHFINVPLGDAVLVDTPGEDLLVDGGSRGSAAVLLAYLAGRNFSRVHVVSASNHDEDHMGGLLPVLERFNVTTVWDSNSTKDTQVYRDFIARARAVPGFLVVTRGDSFELATGVTVRVLNPVQPPEFSKENDNSVALRLEVGAVSLLLAGDCERPCEESMLEANLSLASTFLKAGHHGSRTSTAAAFLDAVAPRVAFLLAGETGFARYGHPHNETVAKLEARGVRHYTTRLNGSIVLETDGRCWRATPERGESLSGCAA